VERDTVCSIVRDTVVSKHYHGDPIVERDTLCTSQTHDCLKIPSWRHSCGKRHRKETLFVDRDKIAEKDTIVRT